MVKYFESAEITKIKYASYEGESKPHEGSLELLVMSREINKQLRLRCFIYGSTLDILFNKHARSGDVINVTLSMGNYDYNDPIRLEKAVKNVEQHPEGHYIAKGQILELQPHPTHRDSDQIVLDCGVYIFMRVRKNAGLKIGDYTMARSRLDAHIIGKVEGKHER